MLIPLLSFLAIFNFARSQSLLSPIPSSQLVTQQTVTTRAEEILVIKEMDLSVRDKNFSVNQVFTDNILLAVKQFPMTLNSGEVFAFHSNILPQYQDQSVKTIGDEFNSQEGYRSAGGIVGDGVCHLASFLNWAGQEAGLKVQAPTSHEFRSIAGIPPEYWVSIRYAKTGHNSSRQNLYIKNNFDFPILFQFQQQGDLLILKVTALRNN